MRALTHGEASAPLRALFERLSDVPGPQQAALLDEAGLGQADRAMLVAMLAADWRCENAPEDPDVTFDHGGEAPVHAGPVESAIGPYRLHELVGRGGSSLVYRATRLIGDVEQVVALKLLNVRWPSPELQRRFRREKFILAQLSHPGIARLLDGGVSDAGVPYIVMEYVEGRQLLEFAAARALDRDARLRLVESVCHAVAAAHRALVVHRDLKPANILVTPDGHVKVLDFGTARLVAADDAATQTRSVELTYGYAAPEQYLGGAIGTAADVYALGVVMGELLTGARPGPDGEWPGGEWPDPAATRRPRGLDAELAAMLRTMLARDPARRYASVVHVAEDIRRFLRHEPLSVRPPSAGYRLRKFVARHRAGVIGTGALLCLVAVATAIAVDRAQAAQQEAAKTRIELDRANALRDFMFFAFGEAEPDVPRANKATIADVVERAIDDARSDRKANPQARVELLTRLGTVIGAQGDLDRAHQLLRHTAQESAQWLGADDPLTEEAERNLAGNAMLRGDLAQARTLLDALERRTAGSSGELRIRVLSNSAALAAREHRLEHARRSGEAALAMARRQPNPTLLSAVLDDYGNVALSIGAIPDAINVYEELVATRRARFGERHVAVAAAEAALSRAYRRAGDFERAEASARQALQTDRAVYAHDAWPMAKHLNALALVLKARRDFAGAIDATREELRINRATLGDDHPDTLGALNNLGMLHSMTDDFAGARAPLRQSLALTAARFGAEHWETAVVRGNVGYVLAESGEAAEGFAELDHAAATFAALPEPDPDGMATVLEKKARAQVDAGKAAEALGTIARMSEQLQRLDVPDRYWTGRAETLRGCALLMLGRAREAVEALQGSRQLQQRAPDADATLLAETLLLLAKGESARRDDTASAAALAEAQRRLAALRSPPGKLVALERALAAQ